MGKKVYKAKYSGKVYNTAHEAAVDNANYLRARNLTEQTNRIPAIYIGGNTQQARNAYWQQEPVLQHAVDSIAGRYGIDSAGLKYRLNNEGYIDQQIRLRNNPDLFVSERGYALLNGDNGAGGAQHFGLDDVATLIEQGKVKPINEQWWDIDFTNEKGRQTHGAQGSTVADNIGLVAATLKYFRNKAKEDFPNASEADLDRYAQAYYNRGEAGGKKWVESGAKGYNYKAYGGSKDSPWNNLSMADKAAMMEVAIRNGITTLPEIREAYNEFAKGGNLYELGGPKSNSYDKPQTFMGRVAQVLGASPHNSRGMDVVSSIAQTLPKASPAVSALDLGYDLNRAYHGEEGALADAGLDILGMLPYISKGGIKAGRGILDVVRGNEKLRKAWNISAGTAKVSDFISDTHGADRTSDAKRIKRALGGNLYPYGGTKKQAFLSSLDQSLKEDNRFDNAQWRQFFTDLADMESGYSSNITNSIGAKGYFQLMPFNRTKTWNNPTQQFHEMYKLTGNNLNYLNKNLTKEDWKRADALGIDMYGMLAGAHLGGAGNVLKALRGKGNAKDMNGTSVMKYMTKFSQKGSVPTLATPTYYEDAPTALFTPSNPEVFFGGYKAPEIEAPLLSIELEDTPQYSEEEIARQERRERLNNLSMLMSLTSPQGSNNSMLDALGLLMR